MSQLQTSLILTGDERQLTAALQRGEASLDGFNDAARRTGQGMKSARDSAAAFEAALSGEQAAVDQLRASLDPLYAATLRYEAGVETLTRGQRLGLITTGEYKEAMRRLTAQHTAVSNAAELQADATRRMMFSTRGGAGGVQNLSFQLQDLFVQVGMGVPIMISLGQQLPQLLSGFGTMGAVAGVAAAGVLPLSAAIFGLGYQSDRTKEKVKTAADEIGEALSAIAEAQSTLRENSIDNLDDIIAKYGEVTGSVLTLMQAQNELAMQRATEETRQGLDLAFADPTFSRLNEIQAKRDELRELLREAQEEVRLNVNVDHARAAIETLQDLLSDEQLEAEIGFGESSLQNLVIFQNAIEDALAADNHQGLLTVVTQLREELQSIPDGPLQGMMAGVVAAEGALREALKTSEDTAEVNERIEGLLTSIGSIDVGAGLRTANAEAQILLGSLNVIDTANLNDAQTYSGRGDGMLEMQLRNGGVDERYAQFVYSGPRLDSNNNPVPESQRSSGADDHARTIQQIEREFARLEPSYARDTEAILRWRDEALAALDPAQAGYDAFASDVEQIFGLKLAEAYENDLARRDDWAAGIERGLISVRDDMVSWANVSENLVTEWSSGMEDAFVEMVKTGKIEVGDLVDYTLEQFARLAYQQAIQPGVEAGFGFLEDLVVGAFGGTTATQSHAGSTIGTGGVRRTYGPGAPLRADERLTVTTLGQRVFTPEQIANGATVVDALASAAANPAGGGGGVVFAPSFQIENRSSGSIQGDVQEQSDENGQRRYKLVLADEVGGALTEPGGGAQRTLRQSYGLRQRGTAR